jgi:hypothetical protein
MRTLFAVTFILALAAGASWAQDTTQLHIYGHPDYGRAGTGAGNTWTTQLSGSGRTEHTTAAITGSIDQHLSNQFGCLGGLREYGASSICDRKFAGGAGR